MADALICRRFVEGRGSLWGQILGSRVTFTAKIYTSLDREMVLLQLYRWEFSHKEWQSLFNLRTLSVVHRKALGRLPIRDN